ncbi:hypothetical protein MTR67_018637 [Solanum verrucosum]|uniref:Reverse transcriptase/retrotransposon-derived protein RNase H-like domain-containing protein n=1 Tax=Solanum verrucosum TaxID=315347 RepID=A0AAF0TLR2_SOLVR|nr:hypothetical protein MTR67_018637 [Solanum verrucosum]
MFSKCEFWFKYVVFLGHIILENGTEVDHKKIYTVKSLPRSLSPLDIRSFLGLADYNRRYVKACEKSFQELKDRLTSTLVLTLPEETDGFVVYCDASRIGLRCVLMQNGNSMPIPQGKLRHYLYVVPVDVFTDHKSLQYVFNHKDLNIHKRRWLMLLKDYDMSVLYHPGKTNVMADALS